LPPTVIETAGVAPDLAANADASASVARQRLPQVIDFLAHGPGDGSLARTVQSPLQNNG
jgi:hypothetical protein